MKGDNKLLICAMLVLMLFLCINACSATEPLNQTLGADIDDEISVSDASSDALGVSGNDDDLTNQFVDEKLTEDPTDVIYVSESGNNQSNGQTRQTAVKTIARAVELANEGHGKVLILEGTYAESNIELDVAKPISIAGEGNVVIDGGAGSNSIFVMHGGEANFTNIKFSNANPQYGGAIFMNSGSGTGRDVIDVNVIVDNCTFDNLAATKRGGAIYALYVQGNLIIRNSNFYNMQVSQWGGAVCAGYSSEGLNVEIFKSRFENNSANNGGGAYLQAKTISIVDSTFDNNSAGYDSGAIYLYDAMATIDNCIIINNKGGSEGVAIKFTRPTSGNPAVKTLTITNSVIENNSGRTAVLPAIYVDMQTLDISYSSLANDLSIQTRTAASYDAVYGQGIAIANNNWWNTNNPTTKVRGENITIDKWLVMNVEASATEVEAGDSVFLYVDFNHVNTTSGILEDLAGGEIPKESYDVKFTVENGTIEPETLVIPKDEIAEAIFTLEGKNALINVKSGEASVDIVFKDQSSQSDYYGIIYVDENGDDNQNGSERAPVASISKAIELADRGSGQIIINEGTYTGNMYHVTKALNITGKGNVILNADGGRLFTMQYGDRADWLILTNLTIIGADSGYGQAIYSYADELILTNLTLTNNPGSGSLIKNNGRLTMDNCVVANHNGASIIDGGKVVLNNTIFENNIVTDYAIVYATDALIENTTFKSNVGQLGIVKVNNKVDVKDSRFINNTNKMAYGGAINDFDELTITNSTFINNTANRNSGAINVATNRKATITKSVFINNTAGAGYHGDAIANSGKLTINYCVLLTNVENSLIYSDSEDEVNARYDWWGSNKNPISLNDVGTYQDDWGNDVFCEIDSSNWVVMNVTTNLTENSIDAGDMVEITVDFTNYIDWTNALKPLGENIPEVDVYASAVNGEMDNAKSTTSNGLVKFTYTANAPGEDIINVTCANAFKEIPLTVAGIAESIIYVDATNGLDTNDGKTRESALQTIEKAVEIADDKIIILEGEYTLNTILNITKDLEIVGEGDVSVKSNARTVIEYEEWDVWDEEWVTKTKTTYSLIENNANLNISNIKFTLVSASISDPLILNNANMLINTSEFNNIKITASKGVIQNIKEATLRVNGSVFTSSSSTYGAINNNGELLVNNCKFLDTDRSGETGVYSTAITSYNKATILNSEFKNNKGSAGGAVYVMYSYTNLANPVMEIENCTFEHNQASGSYGDGAGVRCSGNQVTLTITNSTFNENTAARNGGAVYAQGSVTIDQCVFMQNGATSGDAVYAYGGSLDITNSIILEEGNAITRYESSYSDPATVTANDNWWGSNDAPANIADGITVGSWVKMDAGFTPISAHAGDDVVVSATFDNDKLPDGIIKVTFTSTSGNLNEAVTVYDAQASTTYTIDIGDGDITATSDGASVVMAIEPPAPAGTIYVSYENGDDTKDGLSADNALKTIAHAIELADARIGKIILLQGTHILDNALSITKDLDIKGLGAVEVDGNQNKFIITTANLNLTNIKFTNGYSASEKLIEVSGSDHTLIFDNVKFHDNAARYGIYVPKGNVLNINNSMFYDNDLILANANAMGVIYLNSAESIIENSIFKNNKAQKGGAVYTSRASTATTGSLEIVNCTFESNSAIKGTGGAIFVSSNNNVVNIHNSRFINNTATKGASGGDGAAIYLTTGSPQVNISQSVFIDNNALNDAGIGVNNGNLEITDSIILTGQDDSNHAINVTGGTLSAENNWWGNNNQANTNAEVTKIVKMTATLTPQDAQAGEEVNITVGFDNDKLPKGIINVTLTSTSGSLNELITMNTNQASVNYAGDKRDMSISVKSSQAEILFKFDPDAGIIFVLPGADDTNPGTRDAPVGTIAKALELASKGKIVLLQGTHRTGDLGVISDDLNITGEGHVIVDAQNSNRILYVGEDAKVIISNVIMVNGYTSDESGALLGSSNELTLINCTLANSSASQNNGGAIFSVGKLTIINTTIANCSAVRGGAIYTQTEDEKARLIIVNSTFENNIARGKETWGGGAIYAQRTGGFSELTVTVDNSSFINNKAQGTSCGGAIQIEQLVANVIITNCEFIKNHANGKDDYGGGAVYMSSASRYERQGKMTITGSLFENNTCDSNGGALLAQSVTVNIANSVLVNNTDANGLAVYGLRTETTSPSITLNDNWWGTNANPKAFVGGNNYNPSLSRWAILTITNDTPIVAGNTVKLTVSINNYTTGTVNGTLSKPITVKRDETIKTTFDEITGILQNGQFTCDYEVPENLKYIAVTLDGQTQVLYAVSSPVNIEISDITARKYDKILFEINVTSSDAVNEGVIELYVDGEKLIATIEVKNSKAIGEVVISENEGKYNLTAKYVNGLPLFEDGQKNATLTVSGIYGLYNETFYNFFDENGILRDEITEEELIFHGEFSGLDVDVITVPKSMVIKGENTLLKDMALSIQAGNSKVEDMKFVIDGKDFSSNYGAAIFVSGDNIEINNVSVNYIAPQRADAYAVYVTNANNFKLLGSTIIFDSDNAGAVHHALHIVESDDICVKANTINASLPAREINWHWSEPYFDSIDQESVLAIGIQGGSNGVLSENEINVKTKSASRFEPTIDAVIVYGVTDFEISWNNITQLDSVNAGLAGYSNAIDLYAFEGVTVKYNNILVNSTAGIESKGTAYPIQATGPYVGLLVDHNNLTSISNGPALGIYSQNYDGITDIVITNNNINVTGIATFNVQALVSGMELQDTMAKVYNNTIYSQSKGSYDEANALYGISYSQEIEARDHSYDIRDNTIVTEGKYAVYLKSASDANVTGNTLYANELTGNEAVKVVEGTAVVENNRPFELEMKISVENITVGEDVLVNITFDKNINCTVTLIVDGKEYDVSVVDGYGNKSISDLDAGNYTAIAMVTASDNNYYECSAMFNVAKINSDIQIDVDAKSAENATITVTIVNATGRVTVIVNGKQEDVALENGTATYLIEDIAAGDYSVVVIYHGDKKHGFAYAADSFSIPKLESEVELTAVSEIKVGMETTITVDVTKGATGIVIVNVGGSEYVVDLAKTNNLSVAFDKAGEYSIVASYMGDGKYNASESDVKTIIVGDKLSANVKIEIPDDIKVGDKIIINVTADSDGEILVYINGEAQTFLLQSSPLGASSIDVLKYVLDKKVAYKITKEGIYNITVIAKENNEYASQVVTKIFEATKKDAEINITPITNAKVGDNIIIEVVTNSDGVLTITINDKEVTGGYEITKAGLYAVNVVSAATESYNAGFKTYIFEVAEEPAKQKQEAKVTIDAPSDIKAGENTKVNVTIENATGDVTVIIDGKLNTVTLDKGTATIVIENITSGNHSVVVIYKGDEKYNATLETITFNVAEEPAEPITNMTVVVDGKEYMADIINGTPIVNTNPDSNITVVVDGKEYVAEVVNGTAVVATDPVTNMAVVVDGKEYVAEIINGTPTVATNPVTNITVVVDGVEYVAEVVNGTAVVKTNGTDAVSNITVVVDGVEYVAEVVNGTAVVKTNSTRPVVPKSSEFSEITISDDLSILMVLKDDDGNVIANAPITYTVNGKEGTTTTDKDGKFTINTQNGALITINYAGNATILGTNTTLKLNSPSVPSIVKLATRFNIDNDVTVTSITIKGYAVDTLAGEEGMTYTTVLQDENGKPLANVPINFAVNNKIYNRTTYENGSFNPYHLNMIRAGRYTMAFYYGGDETHNATLACVCVDLDKKPTKIKASSKTYKTSQKTKKYTVTLSTIAGSSLDGKVYLKEGKTVTLTIKDKVYKAKTNAKGQATFKITKLTKKGKYSATLFYKGDKTYEEVTKTVKLTIK